MPVVLSVEEVSRILGCVRRKGYRVCLWTVFSCGLPLGEGVGSQIKDIDSDRLQQSIRLYLVPDHLGEPSHYEYIGTGIRAHLGGDCARLTVFGCTPNSVAMSFWYVPRLCNALITTKSSFRLLVASKRIP